MPSSWLNTKSSDSRIVTMKFRCVMCSSSWAICSLFSRIGGKNIFAYLGLSALGGYEELNEEKPLLPDGATLLDRSRLVYGGAVHSSIECFLSDRLLLVLKAQGRVLLGSDLHRFRPALALGLRFNL